MKLWSGFLLSTGLFLLAASAVSAATYYVDPSGNDGNPGSSAAPFRTVAKGVSVAAPGDTVILNNGTYGNEGHISDGTGGWYGYASPVTITTSGNSSAYITVKAANPGQAILDCGTTSSALGCDKYIVLNAGAKYWTFQGLVFTRGAFGGLGTDSGASYINVLNCQFANIGNWYDTTGVGEDGLGFDQTATNWYVNGNTFHDIGRTGGLSYLDLDHGIYAKGTNVTVTNNIFYNMNKGWSIQVANGATNWLIANNTFAFPSIGNGQIMLWDTITNITIQNNIFYSPASWGVERYQASMSSCLVDHNLVYGASAMMGDTTGCTVTNNNIGGNPNLANPSSYNFQAQAGGAGVDAGVNLSAVPYDRMSVARPQGAGTDMGAYELVASSSGPNISGVFTSGITSNSASVSWSTDQPATSFVQYGLTNSYGSSSTVNSSLLTSHTVSLSGLSASTTYHYRAASTNANGQTSYSPDGVFTTTASAPQPPPPTSFSFSISTNSQTYSVVQGNPAAVGATAALTSGSAANVSFSASGLPAGATASFSTPTCLPTCTTTMTLGTSSSTVPGAYTISVVGTSSAVTASATITLSVSASGTITPTDISTGLTAWWKFTENAGNYAYDSSGYGNTATLYNPTWWTSNYGVTNWFSGSSSYGAVNESASLEMTSQLTVAFWVRPSANSNTDPRVISKLYDWDVKLNGANRYPQFDAGGASATLKYGLPLTTWNHVVFTFSNGTVTGYVNGVQVPMLTSTFSSKTKIANYAYGLFLATYDASLANAFIGSLDDVRLYNRALHAADVAALYAALPRLN